MLQQIGHSNSDFMLLIVVADKDAPCSAISGSVLAEADPCITSPVGIKAIAR